MVYATKSIIPHSADTRSRQHTQLVQYVLTLVACQPDMLLGSLKSVSHLLQCACNLPATVISTAPGLTHLLICPSHYSASISANAPVEMVVVAYYLLLTAYSCLRSRFVTIPVSQCVTLRMATICFALPLIVLQHCTLHTPNYVDDLIFSPFYQLFCANTCD